MRFVTCLVLVLGCLSVGCSPEGAEPVGGASGAAGAAGIGGAGGFGGAGGAGIGGGGACLTFETQPCMCGTMPGRAVCSVGVWSPCDCAGGGAGMGGGGAGGGVEPPGNKRADLSWTWTETVPTGGCRPGHYEGSFEGLYSSSLTFVGAAIPVFALDGTGMPGLEFDLVAGTGGGEILTVSGGKMRGTANGLFPFQFDIEGELDCATLKFNARLVRGFYNVGPIMVGMEGPLTADYDPVTGSMVNGKWVVIEPNPPNQPLTPNFAGGWYGGAGDWRAMYIGP